MRSSSDLLRLTAALSDRYRLERELGSGGMAVVFLAEDLKHRRRVGTFPRFSVFPTRSASASSADP